MRVMRQCFLHYTAADVPFTPRRWQLKRWHKCQSSNFLTLLKIWPAEFPHLFFDCSPAASLSGWPGDFSPRCGSQTSVEELPGGRCTFADSHPSAKVSQTNLRSFCVRCSTRRPRSASCSCLLTLRSASVRTRTVEGSPCVHLFLSHLVKIKISRSDMRAGNTLLKPSVPSGIIQLRD